MIYIVYVIISYLFNTVHIYYLKFDPHLYYTQNSTITSFSLNYIFVYQTLHTNMYTYKIESQTTKY